MILAAGLGTRLRSIPDADPKPLLEVGGRPLIRRSVELLRRQGLASLSVVVGHGAERLVPVLGSFAPEARVVWNPEPAQNGSMRSLALAVESWGRACPEEVVVVEGDLLYGPDALAELCGASAADAVVLCSSATHAGDEVWVQGREGRVEAIGKGTPTRPVLGEMVGLTRIRRPALLAMVLGHRAGGSASEREHYEERLAAVAGRFQLRAHTVEGLVWAEIDHDEHLARALHVVLPRLEAGGDGVSGRG